MATFILRENITYRTKLTKDGVLKALYESPQYKPFGLKPRNNTFKIQRIISYRNSFLPIIEGKIIEVDGAAIVKVKVMPNILVFFFMIFWLSFTFLFSVISIKDMIENGFDAGSLMPIGMFLFGLIFSYGVFKIESIRSKRDLSEILDAEIL